MQWSVHPKSAKTNMPTEPLFVTSSNGITDVNTSVLLSRESVKKAIKTLSDKAQETLEQTTDK